MFVVYLTTLLAYFPKMKISLFFMSMGRDYVPELRPPTGLLFTVVIVGLSTVTPYRLPGVYKSFERTYCLHLQG
jgi:hypothetical protein